MRVALAAVLFAEPDLLLLDEPTNYLDLEGTLWLESYVARYPQTVLLISHDRDLLNRAVNSIVHLDERQAHPLSRRLRSFERQRRERQALQIKLRRKQEAAAQAHAGLRRPLPLQGVQGAPGAVAAEGAGQDAADRGGSPTSAVYPFRLPGAGKRLSPPIVAHGRRRGRL